MTGDQPGHRVVPHGIGNRPHRARRADALGNLFIRHHVSRRNTQECLPDLDLEIRPGHMQVDAVRVTVAAREQPLRDRRDRAWCFLETRARPFGCQFRERGSSTVRRHEA